MKKFLSIIAFAFIIALGGQTMQAQSLSQDSSRPETIAKVKLAELNKSLNLTQDQERALFRAIVQKEVSYNKYVNNANISKVDATNNKAKYDKAYTEVVRKALTDEQFTKWESLNKK